VTRCPERHGASPGASPAGADLSESGKQNGQKMGKGEKKKDKKKEKKEKLAWSNPLLDVVESDEEDEDISPRDVPTSPELLEPLSPQLDLETGTPESGKKKGKKKNGKKWQNGKKDKKKAESNPMLDIDVLGSDEDISPRDASPGPELEPPSPKLASETGTGNTDPKGTVRWLKQRIAKQTAREQEMKLNWKYDPAIRQERDLGPIHPSWAFAFHMGIKDDGAPKDKWPKKQQWDDDDPIPLEAWILCHRLWKYDVHIQFRCAAPQTRAFATTQPPWWPCILRMTSRLALIGCCAAALQLFLAGRRAVLAGRPSVQGPGGGGGQDEDQHAPQGDARDARVYARDGTGE
jgi:hypothetical protein